MAPPACVVHCVGARRPFWIPGKRARVSYEFLAMERLEHVAIITLRRADKLNALNRRLAREVHAALDEVAASAGEIRALVITGEGRGFCSGADVTEWKEAQLEGAHFEEAPRDGRGVSELAPHLRRIPQPVIAAVNGIAAGGGLAIALASDIRIASEQARFASIFVKRSLVPDTAASYTLPKLVGHGIASEMALTGNLFDAQWALRVGLVNRVVPADELIEAAVKVGNDIAANPPLAVMAIKQLLSSWYEDLAAVLPLESAANAPSVGSVDKVESVRAFLEKRAPVFLGR